MPLRDRQTLKELFKNGSRPTESSFGDIIDSSINKIDDGFSKSMEDGLMLSPIGDAKKVLSFFYKITDQHPEWSLNLDEINKVQEVIKQLNFVHQHNDTPVLSLSEKGNVGVNTQTPHFDMDVNGILASNGRLGSAALASTVPADGQWHNIMDNLDHCNAYEVTARVGIHKTGRHALLHATALSAYGNSHHRIRRTRACFSFWRPIRIKIRWHGTTHNYALQIKTSKDLGTDVNVKYYVTQLWQDETMGIPDHYMKTVK